MARRSPALICAVFVATAAACSSGGGQGAAGDGGAGGGSDSATHSDAGGDSGPGGGHDGGGSSGASSSSSSSGGVVEAGEGSGGDGSAAAEGGGCGEFAGDTTPTCSKDGNSLGDCLGGVPSVTACPDGCLHEPSGQASVCMGTTATNWSCTGSYGTVAVDDGNYYLTQFGCYVDSSGNVQTDPGDNCIPSCLSKAIAAGLCPAGSAGPDCEEKINWYTADGARFGCLARLRVTNPATGQAVIAVALDYGPGCTGEQGVQHAVLDASGPVDAYLFGGPKGASEKALVHVVQVDDSYPLGPI